MRADSARFKACLRGGGELRFLKEIWLAAEQPCGKCLKAAVGGWLPHYEQGRLEECIREKLESLSPATIDRLLAPCRVTLGKRVRNPARNAATQGDFRA